MQMFCCSRASFDKVLAVKDVVVITTLKHIPKSWEDRAAAVSISNFDSTVQGLYLAISNQSPDI